MYDIVIIGGGPAGLAAAASAKKAGVDNIIIIDRDCSLGGTLNQCVHTGFGLQIFNEDLTGTEFAQRLIDDIHNLNIIYKLNTTILEINGNKEITAVNGEEGIIDIKAKSIILSTGCREMPRSAINVHGSQCAGIFTAGFAQKLINLDGYMPGKEIVIFGSGDIGLVIAGRLEMEGARVKAVIEERNYCRGKKENEEQCLSDFNIPLLLNHTITGIHGEDRVNAITVSKVDNEGMVIDGSEELISCDTILFAVETLPESNLAEYAGAKISRITGGPETDENMQTSINGIFACGSMTHGYLMADDAAKEGYIAGLEAADFLKRVNI